MPRAPQKRLARPAATIEAKASDGEAPDVVEHEPASPVADGLKSTNVPVAGKDPRDTPAMRQYRRFKQQHPECVLFFRMGDFYEMFDEDAVTCHKALGLTLTQRTQGIPMAGVPYHSVENYLRRMIEQGYRVAVCEQVQDPEEAKTVVDRAVTRVLTPGTLVDDSLLDEGVANSVAAVQFLQSGEQSSAALACAELSTGAFTLMDVPADRIVDELVRLAPSEVLYVETADGNLPPRVEAIRAALQCAFTSRPAWTFRQSDARDTLKTHFGVTHLAGYGLIDDDAAIGPAGALLRYLQETQPDRTSADISPVPKEGGKTVGDAHGSDDCSTLNERRTDTPPPPFTRRAKSLAHLRPPQKQSTTAFVAIDATSLRSLEIERTLRTGDAAGSLISVLQRCRTPMGKRLLRTWLCYPLRDVAAISARQDVVAALLSDAALFAQLADAIAGVQDVARIVGRVTMQRATPRDVVALGLSAAKISAIADLLHGTPALTSHHQRLAGLRQSIAPLAAAIAERCVEEPPNHMREGGLFRDGIDAELDESRLLQRDAQTWLAAYQKRLIELTSINSLKVGYNQVFGYYIEITHTHTQKVPEAFSRKQTLKNAERYVTPELKEFEEKVTTAEARAFERERVLFERLSKQAAAQAGSLSEFAELVAQLDVLTCFADLARRYNYTRPQLVPEPVLDVLQGRHPVLDRTLGERFVPNDCVLRTTSKSPNVQASESPSSSDEALEDVENATLDVSTSGRLEVSTLALITGPNMAGKSTFIRQAALLTLLAHTGSFVPAERATIGLVDRIFTRIGSSDELHAGQSTFMVEMTETANILHHATQRSLVILDEIGRGTSTLDGLSLAWAIAESIARIGCRALFATHYHELTALAERLANVANLHVAVREWGEQIIFLYRILPGRTDRSYGIHVARIAGLPRETVVRAQQLLETLAVQTERSAAPEELQTRTPAHGAQLGLFTEYLDHPAIDELRKIELDGLTPLQAFDALRQLKGQLE